LFEEHPHLELTLDDSAKIWRYMSFSKFVSLLDSRALHFARIETFDDPFEGTLPRASDELLIVNGKKLPDDEIGKIRSGLHRFTRSNVCVNCWHANEHESAAMWQLYSLSGEGIAIQSSMKSLKEALKVAAQPIFIGDVKYIDYSTETIPMQNVLQAVLRKRKSFEHEREIRCLLAVGAEDGDSVARPSFGVSIPIAVDSLIEGLYVSPNVAEWFVRAVEAVCDRFGCAKKPIPGMSERPIY